jgi:hypothetical protein
LSTVYLDFAAAKGSGPANRRQLEAHFQNAPPFILSAEGLTPTDCDIVFVSPRDGEPFCISYGARLTFNEDAPVIACERLGKDGLRLAACANGKIVLADETAVHELLP